MEEFVLQYSYLSVLWKYLDKKISIFLSNLEFVTTQPTFTCLKSTTEAPEKGVNMLKVNNKNTRTTSLTSFWCFYCQLLTYFTHFSSIVDFEQINVSWVNVSLLKIMALLSNHENHLQTIFLPKNIVYLLSYFSSKHFSYLHFLDHCKKYHV